MQSTTPRLVYWWFQRVYDFSYAIGVIGYIISIFAFFHLPQLFGSDLDGEAETVPNCDVSLLGLKAFAAHGHEVRCVRTLEGRVVAVVR